MKKLLVVFMAVLLMGAFVGAVSADDVRDAFDKEFAKAKVMTVEGTVLSHDVKCKCIVVKGASGNVTVQDDYAEFNQDYNRAKGLALNSKVKITYKTVNFINYATKVENVK